VGARQSESVIPIPRATHLESITDSAAAADLELSPADLAAFDAD
jgi:aryl-alcohol dehydrogenase-like predicted oxidoreductase